MTAIERVGVYMIELRKKRALIRIHNIFILDRLNYIKNALSFIINMYKNINDC